MPQPKLNAARNTGTARRILTLHRIRLDLRPQAGVGFLHLDHFVTLERDERDLARSHAIYPVFEIDAVLGLPRFVQRTAHREDDLLVVHPIADALVFNCRLHLRWLRFSITLTCVSLSD